MVVYVGEDGERETRRGWKLINVGSVEESQCIARDAVEIERKILVNCFDPGKEDVPWSGQCGSQSWAQAQVQGVGRKRLRSDTDADRSAKRRIFVMMQGLSSPSSIVC